MTEDKLRKVLALYDSFFAGRNTPSKMLPDFDRPPKNEEEALSHCRRMLEPMNEFLDEGKLGKAFRWLGFMQGVLWVYGHYTLNEMRRHNRDGKG